MSLTPTGISPAVSLWDLFDGNAHLVTQVSPCIDHSISSSTQNHPVAILIVVVLILQINSGIKYTKPHKSNKNKLQASFWSSYLQGISFSLPLQLDSISWSVCDQLLHHGAEPSIKWQPSTHRLPPWAPPLESYLINFRKTNLPHWSSVEK